MSVGIIIVLMMIVRSNAECNISQCIDSSGNLATTPAMQPYYTCIDNASGTLAFQCRCTLRIADCLRRPDGGNCTDMANALLAFDACGQFLVTQNLGCSNTLCDSSSGNTATLVAILLSLACSLLVLVI